jgi:small GTP-binding protein
MPANLPPQYFEKEKELKTARTSEEKIPILEELLAIVPKHKGTEKIQANLKTKIAKLKSQTQKKSGGMRQRSAFLIEKAGAGQVVLIGLPNSGKSSLIKSLTNAQPEIGDYPFTTHSPSPAMMMYENIQIQLVDTPPITSDYMETWHSELIKGADGVLVILDLAGADPSLDFLILQEKLSEKRIELVPFSQEILAEEKQFKKNTLIIGNKKDLPPADKNITELKDNLPQEFELIPISANIENLMDELRSQIFKLLKVLRVYSKIPGKKADHNEPYVFKEGSTLMDMAKSVHKDFYQKLRFARIWGKEKYQGQKVNRDYVLQDEDIIELHI